MAAFSYQALDSNGKKVKGILEGDSSRHVRTLLREKNLRPLDVELSGDTSKSSEDKQRSFLAGFTRVKMNTSELALFTRQLSTLILSGLPLDESLQAVAQQTEKPRLKAMVLDVRTKVLEGHSLAYALGGYPKVFDGMYRAMVNAGEQAGFLGVVLERLADHTESSQYTQQKVKSAMVYPIILMVVALAVITGLMVGVVPDLVKVFNSRGAELPALTRGLIWLSDYLINHGLITLLAILGGIIALQRFMQTPARQMWLGRLKLKLPLVSKIVRAAETSRFSSTLSMLVASGVPLLQAIRISAAVLNNPVLKELCQEVAVNVQEGGSFGKALENTKAFPPLFVHMVSSGEASGELEAMLSKVAQNQERELEMTLTSLVSVLEPLMIVMMSGIVMTIVMAILLPIMDMNTLV
ncbi:MAG: type II secretion system inner membrane protein GspF [Cellvibrionales bacterium]|nr:type II secretion system inner membrane protein GspF [Cellvibrionales bacterium]